MSANTTTPLLLSNGIFGIHGEALALRQQRLELIASNLANADTPHYLARDIDFSAALKAATENPKTAPTETGKESSAAFRRHEVYRLPTQPSLDGNTVDAQNEEASFARAAVEYRATLGFVQGKLNTLRTAITGE